MVSLAQFVGAAYLIHLNPCVHFCDLELDGGIDTRIMNQIVAQSLEWVVLVSQI